MIRKQNLGMKHEELAYKVLFCRSPAIVDHLNVLLYGSSLDCVVFLNKNRISWQ
jgi:hypothetical protein